MKADEPPSATIPATVFATEPPGNFVSRRHATVQVRGAFKIHELHDAMVNAVDFQKIGIHRAQNIDNRVADAQNIYSLFSQF